VRVVSSDNEGAILSCQEELGKVGVILNPVGAGKHVAIAENKIKTVKETARAILHSLQFVLPHKLIRWLISYSVYVVNLLPNKGGHPTIAPREAFLGRKTDYKRDLRVGFGDYCQVVNPYPDNSLKPRTAGGIALCPTGNIQGSVRFMLLHNEEIVSRDQFIAMPLTEDVIKRLSDIEQNSVLAVV
jgi:hypothetical protein